MKNKRNLFRFITMLIAFCMTLSTLALNSFAAPVQHTGYHLDQRTTPITGHSGYSECNFTGNYYSENSPSNNAIIRCEAKGGPKTDFFTSVYARITNSGGGLEYNDSQLAGARVVSVYLSIVSNNIINTTGFGELGCYPYDSDGEPDYFANDSWHYIYYGTWVNAYYGWDA